MRKFGRVIKLFCILVLVVYTDLRAESVHVIKLMCLYTKEEDCTVYKILQNSLKFNFTLLFFSCGY